MPLGESLVSSVSPLYHENKGELRDMDFSSVLEKLEFCLPKEPQTRYDRFRKKETQGCIRYGYFKCPKMKDTSVPNYKFSQKDLFAYELEEGLATEILDYVQKVTSSEYDTVLVNVYKNAKPALGLHMDNEKTMDSTKNIASVTFTREVNEERRLVFYSEPGVTKGPKKTYNLKHGDITYGPYAKHYHGILPNLKNSCHTE